MHDWKAACASFEDFHDEHTVGARLHAAGLTAVVMPPVDPFALCAAREALAYRSGMADSVLAVLGLGSYALAGDAAKQPWLDAVAAGRAVCGFALTEPDAGSDVASIATTARRDGDHWVLDGRKTFISNATIADWFTLFAKTPDGPATPGSTTSP